MGEIFTTSKNCHILLLFPFRETKDVDYSQWDLELYPLQEAEDGNGLGEAGEICKFTLADPSQGYRHCGQFLWFNVCFVFLF